MQGEMSARCRGVMAIGDALCRGGPADTAGATARRVRPGSDPLVRELGTESDVPGMKGRRMRMQAWVVSCGYGQWRGVDRARPLWLACEVVPPWALTLCAVYRWQQ